MEASVNGVASHKASSPSARTDVLRYSRQNKGFSFTEKERQALGIRGLLPPVVRTQEEEAKVVLANFHRCATDLDRYVYLMNLVDRNERLFHRVVGDNIEEIMPIIYTPIVGLACQNYGLVTGVSRGLFITINDAGQVYDVLCNWPENDVKVIVVTDGERILGLGDLGSYGMGIPVGKLMLYTACAGIIPSQCLPVTLDVGTNTQKLLDDPFYIGLKQKRVTGKSYDDFIDEFMEAVVKRFGKNTLVQFEDFGNSNAFRLLEKYQNSYCTFNDDIQGTASVVVAGLLSSLQLTANRLSDQVIVFQGAGEAAIGIAELIVEAMKEEGTSAEDAISKIWMVDSRGLIVVDRPKGGITSIKAVFAKAHPPVDTLEEVISAVKPTAIIGVAAIPGAFTPNIIRAMGQFNKQPIIFALSNPTAKAECTAEQAYTLTDGRCIFASGSPFDPVTIGDKTYLPGQGNNAYLFPSIGLATVLCGASHIPNAVFLVAAKALSKQVTSADFEQGRIYPPLQNIREISVKVALDVIDYMYKTKLATVPEPADKEAFIRSQLYDYTY